MENKMNFNDRNAQVATLAVMNDILASDVEGKTMDDLYNTLCKYAKVSKDQFNELYSQAESQIASWKNNGCLNGELSEDDLDMVVGGSIGSFFSAIGNGICAAASAVGNFVKEHAVEIAIIAGTAIAFAALGGAIGAGVAYLAMSSISGGALAGAAFMGVSGTLCGISIVNGLEKQQA